MFVPIAFENLGVPNASVRLLLTHLGRRLPEKYGESRETFLVQRCSVLLQRFNAVLLYMTVCSLVTAWNFRHTQPFHFH